MNINNLLNRQVVFTKQMTYSNTLKHFGRFASKFNNELNLIIIYDVKCTAPFKQTAIDHIWSRGPYVASHKTLMSTAACLCDNIYC